MPATERRLLEATIERVAGDLMARGIPDAASINAGSCECVVSMVIERLGGLDRFYAMGMDDISVAQFLTPVPGFETECGDFDRDLIGRHWPAIRPPEGLDWEDLDAVAAYADFGVGTHCWIHYEGRHFDAEAPGGVDNMFDLPFFRRIIGSWSLEGRPRSANPPPMPPGGVPA